MSQIAFKPLVSDHLLLLHRWMQQPHVSQWWGEGRPWSLSDIENKYKTYLSGYKVIHGEKKGVSAFIITFQEHPVGFIQIYNASDFPHSFDLNSLSTDRSPSLAALDFYIGESDFLGKGLGADSLKAFLLDYVFHQYESCLVDPDKNNKQAIKTYAKAGFSTLHENDNTILMIAKKKEKRNPIIIFGSARSDGKTLKAIKAVIKDQPIPIVDLRELSISHYDYNYENRNDDFIPLAEKMVRYNPIILATPVYWYTMSALMKTFIDRWSDLLHIRKDIGRRLTNKELFVITSYGDSMPKGFEEAFAQTCEYLDMQYKGCYYFYSGDDSIETMEENNRLADKFFDEICAVPATVAVINAKRRTL